MIPQVREAVAPNGCLVDLAEAFRGRALWDPAAVRCPTLLLRGTLDPTVTRAGALSILARIRAAELAYSEIAGGGHFTLIERSGSLARATIVDFLAVS